MLRVHHAIYFVLLAVLIGSQVVSKFMMSGMQILLTVNWLVEGAYILIARIRRPQNGVRRYDVVDEKMEYGRRWLLFAFLIMMGVHLIWLIGSNNLSYGLDDIFRKLPLLAIPVVVLTSRPLNRKQFTFLMLFFVATVFVATIIGLVRIQTIPDLPYRETVPFISHIRFSLNICIAIVLLIWSYLTSRKQAKRKVDGQKNGKPHFSVTLLHLILVIWFVVFLFILRSYTGFFVLFFTAWIMLLTYWGEMKKARLLVLTSMMALTVAIAAIVEVHVRSYYDCGSCKKTELPKFTANGNPYFHARDGMVENGNLVNNYICEKELCSEWPKHSKMGIYDTTPNGYTVYPTLVRYLNSKGLTKDSVGVASLDAHDVALIEKGVANHVYDEGLVIKKMCYVLLFEHENHRATGSVRNSSMLERMALWHGALLVLLDNPILGVGTGDGVDELHARLKAENSEIADTEKHAHSQYLSFLVTFGLVGFLLIAFAFRYAFVCVRIKRIPAFFAIIVILLISFISEDTMETLAGCVLCTVIPCLIAGTGYADKYEDYYNVKM